MTCPLRIVLPSKGEMEAPTLNFLAAAGLPVSRPNPRQYQATMPAVPNAAVVFQRVDDVVNQVADGSADLGIAGLNNVRESQRGRDSLIIVVEDLGYSGCELVLAVPDTWIDVATIGDLADVALEFRERGRDLRIATKYRHLTSEFLLRKGITHFTLVDSQGAMEAAPNIGNADLIADLTSSGTTLRENHLKTIVGGTILRSQACLIANRTTLRGCPDRLAGVRKILELIRSAPTRNRLSPDHRQYPRRIGRAGRRPDLGAPRAGRPRWTNREPGLWQGGPTAGMLSLSSFVRTSCSTLWSTSERSAAAA
ncbi:MAG: hypothetical protein KatS3mg060_3145 [Dehalococcoidia bacterium]|nr:MAG: hypothetical protein KatS3mg060_3145 [Dehalococcoidia bacterium]